MKDKPAQKNETIALDPSELLGLSQIRKLSVAPSEPVNFSRLMSKIGPTEEVENPGQLAGLKVRPPRSLV
jgi:hypothetical protein